MLKDEWSVVSLEKEFAWCFRVKVLWKRWWITGGVNRRFFRKNLYGFLSCNGWSRFESSGQKNKSRRTCLCLTHDLIGYSLQKTGFNTNMPCWKSGLDTLFLEDNGEEHNTAHWHYLTLDKEASENHLDFFQLFLSREAAVLDDQVQKHRAWPRLLFNTAFKSLHPPLLCVLDRLAAAAAK